jgi:hexosaminidase
LNIPRRFVPAGTLFVLALCASVPAAAAARRWNLIPYPQTLRPLDGQFEPRGGLRVVVSQPANRELHELGELAAEILRESFGLRPSLVPEGAGSKIGPALHLSLVALARGASAEAYVLEITSEGMTLAAPSPAGLYYGLQTLRQILAGAGASPSIPAVRIEDSPRFAYRGIRLDSTVERLPVEAIERAVDLASRYKLNMLRWRLTGPAAWRFEAVRYPRLAAEAGGSYSQEEMRRIVDHARERHVEVVPEIDLGRLGAVAESAYPETACTADAACPPAAAIALAADLAGELVELFPGRVLDIGSAEGRLDPQIWQRVAGVLAARGREVAMAGEPPSATAASGLVLLRSDAATGAAAAKDGFDVIVVAGAQGTLAEAYAFDPEAPGLDAMQAKRLRGADVAVPAGLHSDARVAAAAEALWSPLAARDWTDFASRFEARRADPPTPGEDVAAGPSTPP